MLYGRFGSIRYLIPTFVMVLSVFSFLTSDVSTSLMSTALLRITSTDTGQCSFSIYFSSFSSLPLCCRGHSLQSGIHVFFRGNLAQGLILKVYFSTSFDHILVSEALCSSLILTSNSVLKTLQVFSCKI